MKESEIIGRIKRVYDSCKNIRQAMMARRYVALLKRKHKCLESGLVSQCAYEYSQQLFKKLVKEGIEESNEDSK